MFTTQRPVTKQIQSDFQHKAKTQAGNSGRMMLISETENYSSFGHSCLNPRARKRTGKHCGKELGPQKVVHATLFEDGQITSA